MSAKSTKPGKKMSVPREMTAIQQEYQQLCANAGQVQYQVAIFTRELENINKRLEGVNNEAAARQQLDKAATTKETSTADATGLRTAGLAAVQETTQQGAQ